VAPQDIEVQMDKGVLTATYPRRPLRLPGDAAHFAEWAPHLAELCPAGKGSGREGGRGKKLGFLTLVAESGGFYLLRPSKGFRGAVAESIAALEALADEEESSLSEGARQILDTAYRRLSELLG